MHAMSSKQGVIEGTFSHYKGKSQYFLQGVMQNSPTLQGIEVYLPKNKQYIYKVMYMKLCSIGFTHIH
jgi:hypothetical protein